MSRTLSLLALQAAPRLITDPFSAFAAEVQRGLAAAPDAELLVFPELHLFGDGDPDQHRESALQEAAEPLDGPRVRGLQELASDLGIWLVPGSVCERGPGGELFNTSLLLSPQGEIAGSYRKIFPWRPYEPYDPGDRFTVVDLDGIGRAGLNICYDAWFPEVSRQLAWMGAEVILNVVKTTTPDRAQEMVLARANAIANQVFVVSVNVAAPVGEGLSLVVDPEGGVLAAAPDSAPTALSVVLDLDHVARVRRDGTAGYARPWLQFSPADAPIELPLYGGRIDPNTWEPQAR
ncbi:MAG: carbon-nitrogen hydrolase family protein [Propionibacteriaceae bacterium]